jgi:hypothetical protein
MTTPCYCGQPDGCPDPADSFNPNYYMDLAALTERYIVDAEPVDGLTLTMVDAEAEPLDERTDEVTLKLTVKVRVQHGERWRWSAIEAAQLAPSSLALLMSKAGLDMQRAEPSAPREAVTK